MLVIYEDTEEAEGVWINAGGGVLVKVPPPGPELPPEVWNTTPVDAERCMAAIRAMCGG